MPCCHGESQTNRTPGLLRDRPPCPERGSCVQTFAALFEGAGPSHFALRGRVARTKFPVQIGPLGLGTRSCQTSEPSAKRDPADVSQLRRGWLGGRVPSGYVSTLNANSYGAGPFKRRVCCRTVWAIGREGRCLEERGKALEHHRQTRHPAWRGSSTSTPSNRWKSVSRV